VNWTQTFQVKEQHIKLLRRAYVSWEDCEFGAPSIDCKRPYGNSDVYSDIAEIIGLPSPDIDNDEDFTPEQVAEMDKLHKETQTVLQIFLATGEMKTGVYTADKYSIDWKRQEQ
jgi:hypothetical protein